MATEYVMTEWEYAPGCTARAMLPLDDWRIKECHHILISYGSYNPKAKTFTTAGADPEVWQVFGDRSMKLITPAGVQVWPEDKYLCRGGSQTDLIVI